MTSQTTPDRVSRRRMVLAAAQGLGWRIAGTRLRAVPTPRQVARPPRAAWLLACDGRPALARLRQPG